MAMSRRIARELRTLREIAHYYLTQHTCELCGQPLEDLSKVKLDLGHSTPEPLEGEYTFHHRDGHPNGNKPGKRNNTHGNLGLVHRVCHKRHEAKQMWAKRQAAKKVAGAPAKIS